MSSTMTRSMSVLFHSQIINIKRHITQPVELSLHGQQPWHQI